MSKFIVEVIIILTIVANLLSCDYNERANKINNEDEKMIEIKDGDLINFQLYKSYVVDTSGLREEHNIVEGTPFTFFRQVYSLNTWRKIDVFEETIFEFPDFDFESDDYKDKSLVVTFGRELMEIRKLPYLYGRPIEETIAFLGEDYGQTIEASITFSKEYHDQTMYLYIMDKVYLRDGFASEYYIMDGSEKIFLGLSTDDLNEWISDFK